MIIEKGAAGRRFAPLELHKEVTAELGNFGAVTSFYFVHIGFTQQTSKL